MHQPPLPIRIKTVLKVKVLVTQSCPTLYGPLNCNTPGFSADGILQTRILEWVAIPFSRGSSWPRDKIQVSCNAAHSLSSEPPGKPFYKPCSNVTFLIRLTLMILFKLSSSSQLYHPPSSAFFFTLHLPFLIC